MQITRFIVHVLVIVLALAVAPSTSAASDQTAVMVTVHQFIDDFNKGDEKSGIAACASPVSIIDEFPPHAWHGPTACADWAHAYDANAKENGITDGFVTLGVPWHLDVTGDRAYAVIPAKYAYKQNGKPVEESGSVFTVALQRFRIGWRIDAWTWAKH